MRRCTPVARNGHTLWPLVTAGRIGLCACMGMGSRLFRRDEQSNKDLSRRSLAPGPPAGGRAVSPSAACGANPISARVHCSSFLITTFASTLGVLVHVLACERGVERVHLGGHDVARGELLRAGAVGIGLVRIIIRVLGEAGPGSSVGVVPSVGAAVCWPRATGGRYGRDMGEI